MALDDERVEVLGLLLGEAMQSKVIDDEKVGGEIATEDLFEAVVGAGLSHTRGGVALDEAGRPRGFVTVDAIASALKDDLRGVTPT